MAPQGGRPSRPIADRDGWPIDLRSDVFVPPTEEMWTVMRSAEIGWATFGEDGSVMALESRAAHLLQKEAGLLIPTCSMANLVALMTLAEHGTQVVLGAAAHIVTSEAWGIVSICGAYPRLVDDAPGFPDALEVETVIVESHARRLPRTSVVCLENSHNNAGGVALSPDRVASVIAVARRHEAAIHVDGARLFNAALALELPPHRLVEDVDLVAISLNKGLGAPFGAVLVGTEALVRTARSNLKRLGGSSIHQAGRWAAAALLALDGWADRLAVDHQRAQRLAERLAGIPGVRVVPAERRTNIVLLDLTGLDCPAEDFLRHLAERGVRAFRHSAATVRFVTHARVGAEDVERAADAVGAVAAERSV